MLPSNKRAVKSNSKKHIHSLKLNRANLLQTLLTSRSNITTVSNSLSLPFVSCAPLKAKWRWLPPNTSHELHWKQLAVCWAKSCPDSIVIAITGSVIDIFFNCKVKNFNLRNLFYVKRLKTVLFFIFLRPARSSKINLFLVFS